MPKALTASGFCIMLTFEMKFKNVLPLLHCTAKQHTMATFFTAIV